MTLLPAASLQAMRLRHRARSGHLRHRDGRHQHRPNFISPAFDFSNVNPQKISWRAGGMIAAVGSVLLGILIADYYLIRKRQVVVDDLFTMDEDSQYWYTNGHNRVAVAAVVVAGAVSVASVVLPRLLDGLLWISDYSWFIGCGLGYVVYYVLVQRSAPLSDPGAVEAQV